MKTLPPLRPPSPISGVLFPGLSARRRRQRDVSPRRLRLCSLRASVRSTSAALAPLRLRSQQRLRHQVSLVVGEMGMARYAACYQRWIADQEAGLGDLATAAANAAAGRATEEELRAAVERCMRGYEGYAGSRRVMAREDDGAAFFAPPWCTPFENSVLWLGGCRPSLTIRLMYSLSGEGLEAHVEELIGGRGGAAAGSGAGAGLLGITARQLERINDLHRRTLREEDVLTERLATLQEDIADRPLLPIIRERERERAAAAARGAVGGGAHGHVGSAGCDGLVGHLAAAGTGGVDTEVDAAMESYKTALAKLLEEADELRLATARELATQILTPRQAVETLVAAKQLHLSVHDWSRRRDAATTSNPPNP